MIISVWSVRKTPHKLSAEGIVVAVFLCLLYYLFPMAGSDYYDYKDWVETIGHTDIASIPRYYLHYEKPYYYIVNIVQNNYFLFRLVVWGCSLLLYLSTAKRLRIDKSTFVFYLCICIVQLTAVSRVCLAYALAFYGFSFLVEPITKKGSNLVSFVVGSLIIAISVFFHRSALFLLAVLPLSLLKIDKKSIWLLAIAFPFLVIIVNTNIFGYVFNFDQTDASLLDSETATYYLDSDKESILGVGRIIERILKYGGQVVMLFLIVRNIINESFLSWPKPIQRLANATLLIIVFAASLLLTPGATTYKTFERLIDFVYVPQSLMLAYLLKWDYDKKMVKIFNALIASYVVYGVLYYNFYFGITDF